MTLTSPDGKPTTVRPVEPEELASIPLRCWPEDQETLERLFASQGTIGMAAWKGDRCVGQLHCYRADLPDGKNEDWPGLTDWWSQSDVARKGSLTASGPAWFHVCCHAGRTLETASEKVRPENRAKGIRVGTDPRYFGRGIGTALCEESVLWAREHDYVAVLAPGAPDGLFKFAIWSGHLPWTTYAKLGFKPVALLVGGGELRDGGQGNAPLAVTEEARAALAAGRPVHEFHERLMMLDLRTGS